MSSLEIFIKFLFQQCGESRAILQLQFSKISLQVVNANTFSTSLEVH